MTKTVGKSESQALAEQAMAEALLMARRCCFSCDHRGRVTRHGFSDWAKCRVDGETKPVGQDACEKYRRKR